MLSDPRKTDRESDDFREMLPEGVGVREMCDDLIVDRADRDFEHGYPASARGLRDKPLRQQVGHARVVLDHDRKSARPRVGAHPWRAAVRTVEEPELIGGGVGLPRKKRFGIW